MKDDIGALTLNIPDDLVTFFDRHIVNQPGQFDVVLLHQIYVNTAMSDFMIIKRYVKIYPVKETMVLHVWCSQWLQVFRRYEKLLPGFIIYKQLTKEKLLLLNIGRSHDIPHTH